MDSREPVKTEPGSRYTGILESTSNTKAIQKDSAYTTKQQRAERNKKNEQVFTLWLYFLAYFYSWH